MGRYSLKKPVEQYNILKVNVNKKMEEKSQDVVYSYTIHPKILYDYDFNGIVIIRLFRHYFGTFYLDFVDTFRIFKD